MPRRPNHRNSKARVGEQVWGERVQVRTGDGAPSPDVARVEVDARETASDAPAGQGGRLWSIDHLSRLRGAGVRDVGAIDAAVQIDAKRRNGRSRCQFPTGTADVDVGRTPDETKIG